MCETFNLEYTRHDGIVAWADQDIFDSFSAPGMAEGDKWKIYLGRRIELDEEDKDGSLFIEGLLEDVLFYPVENCNIQWRTFKEAPDVWATRAEMLYDEDEQSEYLDDDNIQQDDEIYQDDGAHIPLNINGSSDCDRLYDAALEFPFRPNNQPFLEMDEYESEDDDDETQGSNVEEDGVEDDDPSASIVAAMPDTIYEGGDEDEDEDEDEEIVSDQEDKGIVGDQENKEIVDDQEDESVQDVGGEAIIDSDDVPGSDWDSDEELSGDEAVVKGCGKF
jgi:hypothetical protein